MNLERKLNRKREHDYASIDGYFITINTKGSVEYFGHVSNSEVVLNQYGKIVEQCFLEIPNHFPNIQIDTYIVMPNHLHSILNIDWDMGNVRNNDCVGNNNYCSLQGYRSLQGQSQPIPWQTKWAKSISSAVSGFKIGVTKQIRTDLNDYEFVWQKSFHDRIIRNEKEYINVRN